MCHETETRNNTREKSSRASRCRASSGAPRVGCAKKSDRVLRQGKTMRFQFIDTHTGLYPVSLMCRILGDTRAGYYVRWWRPLCQRTLANARLSGQIESVYQQSRQTYGYRRVHAATIGNHVHATEGDFGFINIARAIGFLQC